MSWQTLLIRSKVLIRIRHFICTTLIGFLCLLFIISNVEAQPGNSTVIALEQLAQKPTNDVKGYQAEWKTLAPGFEYQAINSIPLSLWSNIYAFRIDLKKNSLSLMTAKELPTTSEAFVKEYAEKAKSLLAINGGFFDSHHLPLGLRISNKRQITPLKRISWWGVFYIKNQKPYITKMKDFRPNQAIEFAVQSGPRLIVDNQIPSLKPGKAERSALGITKDGHLIILVTDKKVLSTTELAHLMRDAPLNCIDALNLDGGSSSQLHVNAGDFLLHVHGFSRVSDAILVNARN